MRLTPPGSIGRFGDIEIRGLQQVVELEAHETRSSLDGGYGGTREESQAVYPAGLRAVQERTAIVVPCKYESIDRMTGVWAAIPANSLIIVVSGSTAEAYAEERHAFKTFCAVTRRSGICVHQSDPQLAAALLGAGMDALLDDNGLVHKGKGEAMVVGTMLAAIAPGPTCQNGSVASEATDLQGGSTCVDDKVGRQNANTRSSAHLGRNFPGYYRYIGFIDADNYVPGSVQEYCKAFSAGLALADADDAMVRINWPSKPKVKDGKLEFQASGRCSQIVNRWLNQLLRNLGVKAAGDGDDISSDEDDEDEADGCFHDSPREPEHICTGNAGEHAMSMSLALKLRLANGYAIEPFHFLDMFERLAGDTSASAAANGMGQDERKRWNKWVPPRPGFASSSPIRLAPVDATDLTPPGSPTFASPGDKMGPAKVQVLQIRTLSAHFHDNKGEAHVVRMWQQGLSAIYHSPLAAALTKYRNHLRTAIFAGDTSVRQLLLMGGDGLEPTPPATTCASAAATPPDVTVEEEDRGINGAAVEAAASWQPGTCRVYPAPGSTDLGAFRDRVLAMDNGSFWCNVGGRTESQMNNGNRS